jgi:hypothetical protein
MDRQRNEIRLLRILPPTFIDPERLLEISDEVLRCEMLYVSLDDVASRKIVSSEISAGMGALSLQDPGSASSTAASSAASRSKTQKERIARLSRLYVKHHERYFKTLAPNDDWDSDEESDLFAYWGKTWLWTSLAEQCCISDTLTGYIALSYVWAEQPKVSDDLARQMKVYRTFQDISPTCADLMAKALPHVAATQAVLEEKADIIVDSVRVLVGKNLEKALRALREIPEVQEGMPVWADALCINQSDIDERNFEVKRMNDIYSRATRVVTWLSEAADHHTHALEFMHVVGEYLRVLEGEMGKDVASRWLATFDLDTMVKHQAVLSDLPYWYRAWVSQEVVLAPPYSTIICQNRRFFWVDIMDFVYAFNKRRTASLSRSELLIKYDLQNPTMGRMFQSFNSHVYCLHDAYAIRALIAKGEVEKSLDAWFGSLYLRLASQCSCKDPRDRVYGFMSMYPGDIACHIQPDYAPAKTLQQVMGDLAIAHIKASLTLDWVLLATDISPIVDPWPSWVPNIAIPYKDITLSWVAGQQAYGNRKVAEVSFGPKESCGVPSLCAKGYKLDVVSSVGSLETSDMDLVHPIVRSTDSREQLLKNLQLHIKAQVKHLLPNMELESFVWVQHYIVTYLLEELELQAQQSAPTRSFQKSHKYGDEAGLRGAVRSCMKAIGWERHPDRDDVPSIFAVPKQRPNERGTEALGILGEDFTNFRNRNSTVDLWGRSLESFFVDNSSSGGGSPALTGPMLKPLEDIHRARRANLFTTAGGYLGANLCRLMPGDEMYLLFGCRMPVVLRSIGEGVHRLIGTVFVCGLMDGEGMEELESSGRVPDEVVIV